MQYLVAVVAALVGAGLSGTFGFVFGGLVGYSAVLLWRQGKDLEQLKRQVASLVLRLSAVPSSGPEQQPPEPVSAPGPGPTSVQFSFLGLFLIEEVAPLPIII